jgi:hypothetical protein
MTFGDYLATQAFRTGDVGQLARDFVMCRSACGTERSISVTQLAHHVDRRHVGNSEFYRRLDVAEKEYLRAQR